MPGVKSRDAHVMYGSVRGKKDQVLEDDHQRWVEDLEALNDIAEALNSAVDARHALDNALERLVSLMGVATAWIFLRDEAAQNKWDGPGFVLAAHHNLPPALAVDRAEAWNKGCDCQTLCLKGKLHAAYNEVRCSRLGGVSGDRRDLEVHASTPLRAGDRVVGILNVAASSWTAFSPRALSLLQNVGRHIGIALERAQLYDLLQERRVQEQALLLDFTNQLLSRLELGALMRFLVDEVRTLLKVDACALLLPDEEDSSMLRFRATSGWRRDPAQDGRQVPADERSSSGRAMRTQQPVILGEVEVVDVAPWMADWLPQERFLSAGAVPLVANGRSIGALLVDSREPRRLEEGEIRLLQLMANQAALALEKARLHVEEVQRQRLDEELAVARQIQLSMLPKENPQAPGWEFVTVYDAARQVGGDFYDFFALPNAGEEHMGVVIADVAGTGMPAALFMAQSRTTIRNVASSERMAASALQRANELILKDSSTELFLTAFYAVIDLKSGRVTYSNAGHNPPLWWKATDGEMAALQTGGIALGVISDVTLENVEIELQAGDLLLFYTDGVTESVNGQWEEFGVARLRDTVRTAASQPASTVAQAVVQAVDAHRGGLLRADDFTLLIVKRTLEGDGVGMENL